MAKNKRQMMIRFLLDQEQQKCHSYTMIFSTLSIKELHAKTGEQVRRVHKNRHPVTITDRGESIAVLVSTDFLQKKSRKRTILPAYAKLIERACSHDVLQDLDAVRGDR